jgi:polyisoprenoid-binding protein YceI
MRRHSSPIRTAAIGIAILIAGSRPAAAPRFAPIDFVIDPARSEVRFTVTKLGFSDVTGTFRESAGDIRYDAANPAASAIRWRVRVASVFTDASNRDRSLQAEEYFHAARHPELVFESRRVTAKPDGVLSVTGDLTMRGATRSITTDVRIRRGLTGPVFETDFEVDRYDYGIAGGTVMGRLIGSTVRVHIRAATQPAPVR